MEFRVEGEQHLRALARDLRAAGDEGKGLRRNLRRNLVASVAPIKEAVQAAALAIPAQGDKSTGLRQAIAAATTTKVSIAQRSALVEVKVDPKKMPDGQHALPSLMEGLSRWRHPVYGNPNVWVGQDAHPYFYRTVEAHLPAVQAAVTAAIDETNLALERGSQ